MSCSGPLSSTTETRTGRKKGDSLLPANRRISFFFHHRRSCHWIALNFISEPKSQNPTPDHTQPCGPVDVMQPMASRVPHWSHPTSKGVVLFSKSSASAPDWNVEGFAASPPLSPFPLPFLFLFPFSFLFPFLFWGSSAFGFSQDVSTPCHCCDLP